MKNKGKLPDADTKKPDKKRGIGQKEEVRRNPDEELSLGSADAFEETENKEVLRAELENDDDDKDKKAKNDQTHY